MDEQQDGEEGAGEGTADGRQNTAEGDGAGEGAAAQNQSSIQDAMAVQSAAGGDMKSRMNSRSSLGGAPGLDGKVAVGESTLVMTAD